MVESVVGESEGECDIFSDPNRVTMPGPVAELQVSFKYFIS
jgi:hypothetical protein